jgi:tripartite-type tricarboxylate transporter receptor subunit TctC
MRIVRTLAAGLLLLAGTMVEGVRAQSVADFYRGKQVQIQVGSAAGAGYDAYGRLVARHLGKHIPGNPNVIVVNKPGAGGLTMANSLVAAGPNDGTAIGAPQSSTIVEGLLHLASRGGSAARFDATTLDFLGSASQDVFVFFVWHTAKAKSFNDLLTTETLMASSGPSTDGSLIAPALNKMFGTKIKLVTGYQSTATSLLAMERGEVESNTMAYASIATLRPDWLRDKKIIFVAQMGMKPHPDLAGVPFVTDLAKTAEDREILQLIFAKYQMGRPYFLPPGVPKDRAQALQAAFAAALKDPELLADAAKAKMEVDPVSGPDVEALVKRLYGMPKDLVRKTRQLLGTE